MPPAGQARHGEGPERASLEKLASELGISDATTFTGAIYDQKSLAPWFNDAWASVSPGALGLSAVHSLAFGVPMVVARDEGHGPEISTIRDGENGARIWEGDGTAITFHDFLRTEFMRVRNYRGEVLCLRNPVDYWTRFNADWLAHPHVVRVVRYEDLLADQEREIREVRRALGYDPDERPIVPVDVDFDKHSPVGANLLSGYKRQTTGNWRRIFTPDDVAHFEAIAGDTLRALGYDTTTPGARPTPAT